MFVAFLNEKAISLILQYGIMEKLVTFITLRPGKILKFNFLFQILQTFSDIWEQDDIDICDDWADLIEYVIQKFVTIMGTNPHACASNLLVSINLNFTFC